MRRMVVLSGAVLAATKVGIHQDLAAIPAGATFNVTVLEEPGGTIFVHRVGPENVANNATYVDHRLTNGRSDAVLSVTPNWNPAGGGDTYNGHPVGIFYDPGEER